MTKTQLVEDRLRRMILDMDIGPGERLTERWLEGQLMASRTSIRTALLRLEGEGLIDRNDRGWIVPPIDPEEIRQLFDYREVLEVAAIRRGGAGLDAAQIAEMKSVLDRVSSEASAEELNDAAHKFHLQIGALSKNEFIEKGIADCMTRLLRVRWIENSTSRKGLDEHRAVLEALEHGRVDHAVELTRNHIEAACARLLLALSEGKRSLRSRGMTIS